MLWERCRETRRKEQKLKRKETRSSTRIGVGERGKKNNKSTEVGRKALKIKRKLKIKKKIELQEKGREETKVIKNKTRSVRKIMRIRVGEGGRTKKHEIRMRGDRNN